MPAYFPEPHDWWISRGWTASPNQHKTRAAGLLFELDLKEQLRWVGLPLEKQKGPDEKLYDRVLNHCGPSVPIIDTEYQRCRDCGLPIGETYDEAREYVSNRKCYWCLQSLTALNYEPPPATRPSPNINWQSEAVSTQLVSSTARAWFCLVIFPLAKRDELKRRYQAWKRPPRGRILRSIKAQVAAIRRAKRLAAAGRAALLDAIQQAWQGGRRYGTPGLGVIDQAYRIGLLAIRRDVDRAKRLDEELFPKAERAAA